MPKVNVNAFGVVNFKFTAYAFNSTSLPLVPSALCLEPFVYASFLNVEALRPTGSASR